MRPMETVPTDRPVLLHLPRGISFRGELHPFVGSEGEDVYGWVCLEEGKSPDNWTDGVCWSVNEDGNPSTKPTGWSEVYRP